MSERQSTDALGESVSDETQSYALAKVDVEVPAWEEARDWQDCPFLE